VALYASCAALPIAFHTPDLMDVHGRSASHYPVFEPDFGDPKLIVVIRGSALFCQLLQCLDLAIEAASEVHSA
jgi:hypothetical protein